MMVRSQKIEGIVLKRFNVRETDRLITLFTKKQGKMTVLSKGIRRITSRYAPHLELFRHIQGYIVSGKTMPLLIEAQTISSFSFLQNDIEKIARAYKFVEEVDRLCPDGQPHEEVFVLLLQALQSLLQTDDHLDIFSSLFTHQLLWELGYLPIQTVLDGIKMDNFIENILERKLKSTTFLTRVVTTVNR